ncbi:hypothetical protein BE20_02890 [Sorangium cellulosum]|nr:hypothetical protein BE20_02890 [Sorangium cellulosum]
MPSFVTGKGKPGARIVSRKTRAGMPVTASTFFCESIVAVGLNTMGRCDPPTGRSSTILSVARMPLSA